LINFDILVDFKRIPLFGEKPWFLLNTKKRLIALDNLGEFL